MEERNDNSIPQRSTTKENAEGFFFEVRKDLHTLAALACDGAIFSEGVEN